MAFRSEYVEAAYIDDFLVFGVSNFLCLFQRTCPLIRARLIRIDLFLLQVLLGEELRVAAQQNIGAAPGHIGCYRNLLLTPCLCDDVSFAGGMLWLCIQYIMWHSDLF